MEDPIPASVLNDFIFCPASIYYHKFYYNRDVMGYQSTFQINGTNAHKSVDTNNYSTRADIITSLSVYSEQYNVIAKIDVYDQKAKKLIERKKHISNIYDGYVYQLYAQYYGMLEMGYPVEKLQLYSFDDNKKYDIPLPSEDKRYYNGFVSLIEEITCFNIEDYYPSNIEKCRNCIYEPACDRTLFVEEE